MNTQSLHNKGAIFTDFICDYKQDIIAVTETWFQENESTARVLCTPICYNLLDNLRLSRQGWHPVNNNGLFTVHPHRRESVHEPHVELR